MQGYDCTVFEAGYGVTPYTDIYYINGTQKYPPKFLLTVWYTNVIVVDLLAIT
jgi:hypothetical protein